MSLLDKENVPPAQGTSRSAVASSSMTRTQSITSDGPPLKRARTSIDGAHQAGFEEDLCKVFMACGIPWNVATNPQMKSFVGKWIGSDIVVLDQRILSGRVLDAEVKKVESKMKSKVCGKVETG